MSDTDFGAAPVGPSHTEMAQRNASEQQGSGKLLGPRAGRDVSRPMTRTFLKASSTKDQATKGHP